jgi:hypothetical protein
MTSNDLFNKYLTGTAPVDRKAQEQLQCRSRPKTPSCTKLPFAGSTNAGMRSIKPRITDHRRQNGVQQSFGEC